MSTQRKFCHPAALQFSRYSRLPNKETLKFITTSIWNDGFNEDESIYTLENTETVIGGTHRTIAAILNMD